MPAVARLDKFLLIRSLSCLVVFFSHIPIWKYIENSNSLSKILVFNGRSAVTIFFVLSGYLITKQFLSGKYTTDYVGAKKFWINRLKRILPITYLSILFSIILKPEILTNQAGFWKILKAILFYFDVDSQPQFMNQLWSLSVEMQFYFVVPFILFVLNKYSKKLSYLISLGILSLLGTFGYRRFAVNFLEQFSALNQIRHFGLHFFFLFFGVLTAYFEILLKNLSENKFAMKCKAFWNKNYDSIFWTALFFNFVLIWFVRIFYGVRSFDVLWFTLVQMLSVSFLILIVNVNNSQVRNLEFNFSLKQGLKERLINFVNNFGTLSFPFYLVHSEIIAVTSAMVNNSWAIGISLVVSYWVALIIYKLSSILVPTSDVVLAKSWK